MLIALRQQLPTRPLPLKLEDLVDGVARVEYGERTLSVFRLRFGAERDILGTVFGVFSFPRNGNKLACHSVDGM
jgi:hypothetical protein